MKKAKYKGRAQKNSDALRVEAITEGAVAFANEKLRTSNPYDPGVAREQYLAWFTGWDTADRNERILH